MQATAGQPKLLHVQCAIKLCERIKTQQETQFYEASLKVDGYDRP
jgi:hypothetical protein